MRIGPCDGYGLFVTISVSAIGALCGSVIFVLCFFFFHNYNAGVWGLFSGIFALCVLHLNLLYLRNIIEEWYDPDALENLKLLGLLASLSSVVGFGTYLTLAVRRHQSFDVSGFNYYPAVISTALTFLWGSFLFFNSLHYKRYVRQCNPQLIYGVRRFPQINCAP